MTDCEVRFSELSRHALMILPTDAERVRILVSGLHYGIQATMAQEVETGTSYGLVVEITRRIGGVRQWSREQTARDKQFRYSGEFSGDLAGGRGQFVRGQSNRPHYPAPPPPQGALVRPYFSIIPESSYRPPAIQGSSNEYSGHQGQTSSQQSIIPRGCFEYGDLSHVWRFFPRLHGRPVQQGQQPMIIAPVSPPAIRPPRGGWQVDFHAKTVTLAMPELPRLEWKARHMVEKGCLAYLSYVKDTTAETPTIDSILVVREFSDVFPFDLPGYYHRFVEEFSSITAPLTRLTRKHALFQLFDDCEEGRVIVYASRQLKPYENSYLVHDLELAAIVHILKIWRHYLYGVSCKVYTDHRNLQHLFKQRDLNLRQRR
ncbi:uncharacterized protein [Nicotiana tomentosiformis]|uniref:uncharacterized protein n=1 Tax=Nicotiana tomentosiformis TaxID=4098 RepID=UPI00388C6979